MDISSARLLGAGVALDPELGRIRIPAAALQTGLAVVVGGPAPFRLTAAAVALAAPAAVSPPSLLGTGTIGTTVSVDPGQWSGDPAPDLAFAWLRDGVAIPDATGPNYQPLAADDRTGLSCRVTATSLIGSASATTARLAVAWPAPLVVADLPDRAFAAGSGLQAVETAFAFAGSGLAYAVTGAGATIDQGTGVLTIDTATAGDTAVTVTASNSGGAVERSFALRVTAPVTPEPEPEPVADVAPASMSLVTSTLAAWARDWAGTVPAGKTLSDQRYIDMPSGSHTMLSLSNLNFPQPVHVRSADRITLGALFPRILLSNCTNVLIEFARVERNTFLPSSDGAVHLAGCTNCGFNYGTTRGPAELSAEGVGKRFGLIVNGSTDCEYRHNLLTDWSVGASISSCTRFRFEDNVLDNMKGDDTKIGGGKDIYFTRNWSSLIKRLYAAGDHTDYNQDQSDVNNAWNGTFVRDGFFMEGHIIYQKTVNFRSFQGLYFGGYGIRQNIKINNSVLLANNGNVKFKSPSVVGDPTNGVTNCNGLYAAPAKSDGLSKGNGYLDRMGGTNSKNIVSRIDMKDWGAGADGLYIECGPNLENQHYENQHAYFIGPVQSAASENSPIKELTPIEGTVAHWDHPSPVGAHARMKDIVVNGIHPGNSPNPVLAAYWQATWNWDGFVTA